MVATYCWFAFNAIYIAYLFALTLEFAQTLIVKENKLSLWVTRQPSVMKKS
jgi:hypothetical protein